MPLLCRMALLHLMVPKYGLGRSEKLLRHYGEREVNLATLFEQFR